MQIKADYFNGQQAQSFAVTVDFLHGELRFPDPLTFEPIRWSTADVEIEKVGRNDLLIALRKNPRVHLSLSQRTEALSALGIKERFPLSTSVRLALLLGCIVLTFGCMYFFADDLSQLAAHQVPIAQEREWGSKLSESYMDHTCLNEEANAIVRRLARQLLEHNPLRKTWWLDVHISESAQVNAFALPGGNIVIMQGLIDKAQSPDELAGVLAHEIEHVVQRHITASIIRASFLTLAWSAALGDISGFVFVDPATMSELLNLKYGREAELAADAGAVQMLDAAGISRKGLIAFFERINEAPTEKYTKHLEILSTHPYSAKRAELLRHGLVEGKKDALTEKEFHTLKAACGGARDPHPAQKKSGLKY